MSCHFVFLSLHRLLIGAPTARALSNQGANITGGLYSCDITTHPDDCTRVDFDNDGKQKYHHIASKKSVYLRFNNFTVDVSYTLKNAGLF